MNLKKPVGLLAIVAGAIVQLQAQPAPGTVLWTYEAGSPIVASPSLGEDGSVYILAPYLSAITNSGSLASNKWTTSVGSTITPAVASDGTVLVISGSGLHSINPTTGSSALLYPVVGAVGSLAIGFDGSVLFVVNGRIYAVNRSGLKKWEYLLDATGIGLQAPVVDDNGTVYVGLERSLYAFSPEGSNKWVASLQAIGSDSPVVGGDGAIFSIAGRLHAFASAGTNIWLTEHEAFAGSACVGSGHMMYLPDVGRRLRAVNRDGQPSWQVFTNVPQYGNYTCPAVDARERVYYCVSNSVWCLNSKGQPEWKVSSGQLSDPRFDLANTSPIIGPDGTLYAALGSTLYAVATGTNGPAKSSWPMYRGNAQHTGSAEKPALKQPKKRADANFEFQLYGQLGQTNVIEASTNLSTWTSLTSIVVSTVPQDVVDLTASNHPTRLYRAAPSP